MSNGIQYDPLLTFHLARELEERLHGRACAASPVYSEDLAVILPLSGGEALRCDLHPRRGWIRIVPAPPAPESAAAIAGVVAPHDERSLTVLLDVGDRFRVRRRGLTLELHTNQWNALLCEEGRIISALRSRSAGDRSLWPGEAYVAVPPRARFGAGEVAKEEALEYWSRHLLAAEPERRRKVLLDHFAFTGALNAEWILTPFDGAASAPSSNGGFEPEQMDGSASPSSGQEQVVESFERWWSLRERRAEPCVLSLDRGRQPYPFPLEGVPAIRLPSLLTAMAEVAEGEPEAAADSRLEPARELATRSLAAASRRVARLREQLAAAGAAERLRERGDLLLANLHRIEKGVPSVQLADWNGVRIEIPLDPSLTPAENAAALYDAAKRKRRAEAQLPELISRAEDEVVRWTGAAESIARGDLPDWVIGALNREPRRPGDAGIAAGAARPYRTFRTSGGLEVRVGRSSGDNDRLTFGESSPNDVWLHARSVPGSHVILRWPHAEASPPARDLGEAAQLAAVFSRARTSATVPVDWTRRKYVRKPRGAAAGLVIPQRVKTLFVEPDPAVVERLSPGDDGGE